MWGGRPPHDRLEKLAAAAFTICDEDDDEYQNEDKFEEIAGEQMLCEEENAQVPRCDHRCLQPVVQ